MGALYAGLNACVRPNLPRVAIVYLSAFISCLAFTTFIALFFRL